MSTMSRRLVKMFRSCVDSDIEAGSSWYSDANAIAKDLSNKFFLSSESHAAAVISVLSPSVQWETNVKDAFAVCAARQNEEVKVSTYGPQKWKAIAIRDGDDPSNWIRQKTAPKTYAFWRCIENPRNTEHVVVDRHALAACLGRRLTDKERGAMLKRVGGYEMYSQVYRDAAKEVGILPLQMQAICWIVWRNQGGVI